MKKLHNRILELEALRGIAAFCVMCFHYTSFFRKDFNYNFSSSFDFKYGHYGVQLFFMISGFVIYMTLQNIKTTNEFFFKRFLRLYPTYWICLIITLLFISILPSSNFTVLLADKILNFLMFQGLFNIRNVDGSYWSLIPELFFYLMIIFLWKFKFLKNIYTVSIVWIFLMFLALLKPSMIDVFLNLKFGMFFLIGIMFFKLKSDLKDKRPHLIIFLSLITTYIISNSLELLLFTTGFVILFYFLIHNKLLFLNTPTLLFLGKISYPFYLLHQTIGYLLINKFIKLGILDYLSILLVIILIILLSWLVYYYLEQPIIRILKKKIYTSVKLLT